MKQNLRFVSPRDRVLYLRSLPALEGVGTADLMAMAQHMREVHLKPGDYIYRAGDPLKAAFMLVEGVVEFRRNGEVVATEDAPAPIAFIGVLGGLEQIPGDVVAATSCLVLRISIRSILQIWEASFSVYANSLRIAASRIFEDRGRWPFNPENPPDAEVGEYPEKSSTLIERMKFMRDAGPFADANLEAIGELCRNQREVRFQPGEVIWREGDDATFFIRVDYGLIDVVQEGRAEPGVLGHDYSLGFFESMGRLPRGYTATARTEVVATRSEVDTMLSVFEDHFTLAMNVLRILSQLAVERLWKTDDLVLMAR